MEIIDFRNNEFLFVANATSHTVTENAEAEANTDERNRAENFIFYNTGYP